MSTISTAYFLPPIVEALRRAPSWPARARTGRARRSRRPGPCSGLTKPILSVWSACETRGAAQTWRARAAPETTRPPAPDTGALEQLSPARSARCLVSHAFLLGRLRPPSPSERERYDGSGCLGCQDTVPLLEQRRDMRRLRERPVAVARARARDPLGVPLRRARCSASATSPARSASAASRAPLRRHPGAARLPAAGRGDAQVPARARACSTSASRRSTRWSCASSRRRTCRSSRDETGHTVNMAILDGIDIVYIERCRTSQPRPARDRPQPARRLAAARLLHLDGQGAARVPAAGRARGAARADRISPGAGRTRSRPARALRDELARVRASGRRGQQRGARLRPALDRRRRPRARREPSPRSTSPSTARSSRWRTWSTGSARAHRDRRQHLVAPRLATGPLTLR